jgi:hypothetical protein
VLGTDDVVEILEYLINQNTDSLASCVTKTRRRRTKY